MTSHHNQSPNQHGVELTLDDLEALALGAWILGTGGGGDPYHKYLNVRELCKQGHKVRLVNPLDLADDALIAVVSTMGAPLVGQERLVDAEVAVQPVRMLERYLGRSFDAVMSVEIGGGNGLQPMMIGALADIPVVDADAMGRAYPEAQMTSFAVAGLQPYPFAMADVRNNSAIITAAEDWKWMERMSRKLCTEMGSTAATCKAPRSGREVKEHGILHTVTKATDLGRAVLLAQREHRDPVQAIVDACAGKHLFSGKVVEVERRTTEGFLRGQATLEGVGADQGERYCLHFQNEFSVGVRGDVPEIMTPDLICVVDSVSGNGIGTDVIRYGQRVSVLALPAPAVFLSEAGLAFVGPRAFGFDLDFQSVFATQR